MLSNVDDLINPNTGDWDVDLTSHRESVWKRMWKMKCPNKLKQFLWRFMHNSHALRMNLKRRKMDVDTRCVVCQRFDEDVGHLFFKCKEARRAWSLMNLEHHRIALAVMVNPMEVVEYIISLPTETRIKIISLLWFWWSERKRRREGEGIRDAASIAHSSQIYAMEVIQCGNHTQQCKEKPQRWSRPGEGVIKINCDASFYAQNNDGGWGYIARDSDGDVVLASKGKIECAMNSFHAELVACLQGVQAAIDMGVTRVIVETDATMVKQAVQTDDYALDGVGGIVKELKEALHFNFVFYDVVYSPRNCNKVAHALAALGYQSAVEDNPIVDVLPDCIRVLVADDLTAHE